MQVKSIAECSKGSILQYFRPSLSYHLPLRPLFCLSLSGRLRQVLLLWYIVEPVGYLDFVEGHGNQSDIMAVHFLIALSDK